MKSLMILIAFVFSTSLYAREIPELDADRTVRIDSIISQKNLLPLQRAMYTMAEDSHEPINVIINSPGGRVDSAYEFIQVMDELRDNGVEVRCFVSNLAASMAFSIFTHCEKRYALNNAALLWHQAKLAVIPKTVERDNAEQQLIGINAAILTDLINTLGRYMDHDVLATIFSNQVLHQALMLDRLAPGFMEVYPEIPGLIELMKAPSK